MAEDEVSTGEVWRATQRIEAALDALRLDVHAVRTSDAVSSEKVRRLEGVVYGTAAATGAALATAVVSAAMTTFGG